MTAQSIGAGVIGRVHSSITCMADSPRQGDEGAGAAWLVIDPVYSEALAGIQRGQSLVILTWLHEARRNVLQVHPRRDTDAAMTGVFATRSPHRPNPIGLHPVHVLAVAADRLLVAPIEAIDGTPILDIKIAL
jgi:tRNA-Thr(GGU) m(6)t(6)A37 methyltransferase TsaA